MSHARLGKGPVKTMAVSQMAVDGGVDQGERGEDGEKWSESVWFLKVASRGLRD